MCSKYQSALTRRCGPSEMRALSLLGLNVKPRGQQGLAMQCAGDICTWDVFYLSGVVITPALLWWPVSGRHRPEPTTSTRLSRLRPETFKHFPLSAFVLAPHLTPASCCPAHKLLHRAS
jgi:hypothetical protein